MPKVVHSLAPTLTHSIFLDRRFWILASMTLLCPLAFLRRLDSLRVTSYIALCTIAYLVRPLLFPSPWLLSTDASGTQVFIVIFYTFVSHDELPPSGDVELFRFGSSFITSLPVQVFAFTCTSPFLPSAAPSAHVSSALAGAQNIFAVFNELRAVRRSLPSSEDPSLTSLAIRRTPSLG